MAVSSLQIGSNSYTRIITPTKVFHLLSEWGILPKYFLCCECLVVIGKWQSFQYFDVTAIAHISFILTSARLSLFLMHCPNMTPTCFARKGKCMAWVTWTVISTATLVFLCTPHQKLCWEKFYQPLICNLLYCMDGRVWRRMWSCQTSCLHTQWTIYQDDFFNTGCPYAIPALSKLPDWPSLGPGSVESITPAQSCRLNLGSNKREGLNGRYSGRHCHL